MWISTFAHMSLTLCALSLFPLLSLAIFPWKTVTNDRLFCLVPPYILGALLNFCVVNYMAGEGMVLLGGRYDAI